MELEDDITKVDPIDDAEATGGLLEESSLLASLARQRKEIADNRDTFIDIPGYEKAGLTLWVNYQLVDFKHLAKLGRSIEREYKDKADRSLYGSIDVILSACVGFYYQVNGEVDASGKPVRHPLTVGGQHITAYDERLAQALQFGDKIDPQHPARSVLLGVFGYNELAVQQHNLRLGKWMGNTEVDVTEEFLEGNS